MVDRASVEAGYRSILEGEGPIEKAAVNFSAVSGDVPPKLAEAMLTEASEFYASGVSIIVHPLNPHAPTFHANLRYFEADGSRAWFGGGADLTPYYLYEEDARHFHSVLFDVCARHEVADYERWKAQCDEYFYLPHRGERRGVGGLFFSHVSEDLDAVWDFQQDLGARLSDAYAPIVDRRVSVSHDADQARWQEIRRGRYAEFNLVWDRGTRFGLESSGRVESILASLPPRARWVYDYSPTPGSPEDQLVQVLMGEPRAWV